MAQQQNVYKKDTVWLRSMPVHPAARATLEEVLPLPSELIDLIIGFAERPEPLSLHRGKWCMPSAPCIFCRAHPSHVKDPF